MRAKLKKELLERDLSSFLKNSLIEKFNLIKNKENPSKIEIKFLSYHALAYFQFLNALSTNQAIRLFKDYILSDGTANKFVDRFYYVDGTENKVKMKEISITLYIDELLSEVSKYLMNYKNIVNTISKDGYTGYFSKKYNVNTSDIPTYKIIKNLLNIDPYVLVALKSHITVLYKEIFPFLLEKAQVVE